MILILDKNTDILNSYKDFYSSLCLSSVGFTNTSDAYSFFINNQKDIRLVTVEFSLDTRADGLSFARDIKKISPPLPIILITWDLLSLPPETDLFAAILTKPIGPAELAKKISELLRD